MREKIHDIIAPSNKMGHHEIFPTMTCNPNWPAIRRSPVSPGSARSLRESLQREAQTFMESVNKDMIYGDVVVKVIEFRQRGLPRCIFILAQASNDALPNPSLGDAVISADLPLEEEDELGDVVLQHMNHNPCGSNNPLSVCMEDQGTRKTFPSF